MKKLWKPLVIFLISIFLIVILWLPTSVTAVENKVLIFDSKQALTEYQWNFKELNTEMPSDWSSFRFLVMEMKASSGQRFQIKVNTAAGTSAVYMHPFQNTLIRAAIPLEIFQSPPKRGNDTAFLLNNQNVGYFMFNTGPYVPLDRVNSISIAMPEPLGEASLEIKYIRLTKDFPGNVVLENQPLVDRFGQWIRDKWAEKIPNIEELRLAWREEEQELKAGDFDYCQYGGYCATKAKATGFFRVQSIAGKWWFVDPEGHLFFSTGVNSIVPSITTPIEGRESIFAELPPGSPPFTRVDRGRNATSFYQWNIWRRFGEEWQKTWVDFTVRRMQAWGINTIANWSDNLMVNSQRMPYVLPISGWETKQSYLRFPDVYSEEFVKNTDEAAAKQCATRKNDRFLLGYFIANEPAWPGRELEVIDMILSGQDTAIRRELQKYLAAGDTPERRKEFFYRAFERYVTVVNNAIRKYDPNHLIFGIRYAGYAPDEMVKISRIFDVFTVNKYEYYLNIEEVQKYNRLSDRPLLIGEFHFGVPGRGMSAGLKQVRDRQERGVAYRYYVENAAAMPEVVGTHWFQWSDQPSTGRYDGENYNIGVVDVTDRPYPKLIEAMKETHRRLYAIHSGKEKAIAQRPLIN